MRFEKGPGRTASQPDRVAIGLARQVRPGRGAFLACRRSLHARRTGRCHRKAGSPGGGAGEAEFGSAVVREPTAPRERPPARSAAASKEAFPAYALLVYFEFGKAATPL